MSAPDLDYRQAKYLGYGFLAAKAEQAAVALIQQHGVLTDEQRAVLKSGSEFLKQVAAGAQVLTSGDYRVQNLTSAIEAFEFAIDPLEQLGGILTQPDVAQALNEAAEAVSSKLADGNPPAFSAEELNAIELFRHFFENFYAFVRDHVARVSYATLLGDSNRFNKLA